MHSRLVKWLYTASPARLTRQRVHSRATLDCSPNVAVSNLTQSKFSGLDKGSEQDDRTLDCDLSRCYTHGHKQNAGVTQLEECLLPKQNVVGSSPITRSRMTRTGPCVAGLSLNPARTEEICEQRGSLRLTSSWHVTSSTGEAVASGYIPQLTDESGVSRCGSHVRHFQKLVMAPDCARSVRDDLENGGRTEDQRPNDRHSNVAADHP